ncbi:uncharacterized protein LOC119551397 isoform X2 [Drosophila subpulchrella]|uniref:uncharacterized protein LOC119551397 isoform X2 n=1 Tax=Drosophila subpulchrella TaxID=1486046 RepID=UPI0018A1394F|nr:uncharacterized protein LOC119551397 isoform X2 [Drosophila subpulchrella]
MKWSLVLVFLFGILAMTTSKPPINWRRDFKTTRDCERQENVSSIDAYEAVFLKKNEPVDYKVKCFLHCAIEESVNFIQSFNLVPLRKVDNCMLIKDEDKCEEGLMKFKCYYKN